jgi:hypothetical protein
MMMTKMKTTKLMMRDALRGGYHCTTFWTTRYTPLHASVDDRTMGPLFLLSFFLSAIPAARYPRSCILLPGNDCN